MAVPAQGGDPHPGRRRPRHQLPLGEAGQGEQEVQPRSLSRQGRAGDGPQGLGEQGALAPVQAAHAPQVPAVQPLDQEAPQGLLLKPGDGAGSVGEHLPVPLQQGGGQDHVGHPDGGGDGPGKGAQVHHPPLPVQPLHSGDGAGGVAELAVVVVLNEVAPRGGVGPVEQPGAPARRHGHPRGELVGGGDVGQGGAAGGQGLRVHALAVDGNGQHGFSAAPGHGVAHRIARVLQGHGGVLGQHLEQGGEQVVHPRPHHHLLRGAVDPPHLAQQVGQGRPEGEVPLGVAPLEQVGVFVHRLLGDPGPGGEGKQGGVHRRGGAVVPPPGGGRGGLGHVGGGPGGEGQQVGHHIAAAGPGEEIALGGEHGVGGVHRAHAHPQQGAQLPLGGHFAPGGGAAPAQLLHQMAVELLIQGFSGVKDGEGDGLFHGIPPN